MLVKDASSLYALIKQNKYFTGKEDQEMVAVLEDQLAARVRAANLDGRTGDNRDSYIFFQGLLIGMYLNAKILRHQMEVDAHEQGRDLKTGKRKKDH